MSMFSDVAVQYFLGLKLKGTLHFFCGDPTLKKHISCISTPPHLLDHTKKEPEVSTVLVILHLISSSQFTQSHLTLPALLCLLMSTEMPWM